MEMVSYSRVARSRGKRLLYGQVVEFQNSRTNARLGSRIEGLLTHMEFGSELGYVLGPRLIRDGGGL
jgi:hypothetical protein